MIILAILLGVVALWFTLLAIIIVELAIAKKESYDDDIL